MSEEVIDWLLANEAGQLLGLAPSTVVSHAKAGKLPVQKTASGVHLFRRKDVLCFKQQRESERAKQAQAAVEST